MNFTPDELRQQAAAMIAKANGKQLQFRGSHEWIDLDPNAGLRWELYLYRPKPEPVTRPWDRQSDVPMPTCWLHTNTGAQLQVTGLSDSGIFASGRWWVWNEIGDWSYSTDGNPEHAKPCTTEESK